MLELIALIATVSATVFGYIRARSFVQRRLLYVDSIQSSAAPVIAGIGAAILATPLAWALPLIGSGTALLFGAGIGAGVAAGRRGIRQRLPAG
ncbi:hypothetical protein BH23GEM8_BH23GEM8_19890 [soil metagenome]